MILYHIIFPRLEFTRKDDMSRRQHQARVMKMISRPLCSVMLVSFEFSLLSIPLSSSPPLSVTFALLTIAFSSTRALRTPYRNNLSVYFLLFLTLGCCESLLMSLSYALRLRTLLAVCLLRILASLSPSLLFSSAASCAACARNFCRFMFGKSCCGTKYLSGSIARECLSVI